MSELEQLTKRFADILNLLDEGDTITISREDLREAIIELREETMVKATTLQKKRDAEVIKKEYERLTGFVRELLQYADDLSDGQIVKLQRLRDELKAIESNSD